MLNERFGTEFDEEDRLFSRALAARLGDGILAYLRDRMLGELILRLLDREISLAAYRRARRKLPQSSNLAEWIASIPADFAELRQQRAGVTRIAAQWLEASSHQDVERQGVVLHELIEAVVPVRLSLGQYKAVIRWTPFAGDYLAARDG